MKATFAVIVTLVILPISWLAFSALLLGLLYAVMHVHAGFGPLNELHFLTIWIFGATFGGFCATYATPRIFRSVKPETIAIAFGSIVVALLVLGAIPAFLGPAQGPTFYLVYFGHALAIVIGAKIGQSMASVASDIAYPLVQKEALRQD